ncbi:MAG: NAD-dependent epimerase/dehydratase family protein, partial [Caulobacteraceae bacterium]
VGTFNVLEIAKAVRPRHFLHASTSSIYGADSRAPFCERAASDHPLSLYAATKKAGEAMSHAWAHLWKIPTTALRFFTVYGPWGRPDMAAFKFVEAIRAGRQIEVHNGGRMERDFTFIDDLVESLVRLIGLPPVTGTKGAGEIDSLSPTAPWRAVNVGGGEPVTLDRFIACIEAALGARARCQPVPMGAGEMERTDADPRLLQALIGYAPATAIEEGVRALCAWHLEHYPQGAPLPR